MNVLQEDSNVIRVYAILVASICCIALSRAELLRFGRSNGRSIIMRIDETKKSGSDIIQSFEKSQVTS